MIYLNWHRSANFGDRLSKIIAEHLSKEKVVTYNGEDLEHYMLVGSIANHANENTIIWGAGVANTNDYIPKVKAVPMIRGLLSKEIAERSGNEVDKVGDPVLLMPQIYKPKVTKKYKLGIIPHVVEYLGVCTRYMDSEGVLVIDLCKHPFEVIKDILSCEQTISSSLHGIIASHAYGVPCEWVRFSNKIGGDGFKYLDYFSSVGIPEHDAIDLEHSHQYIEIPHYDIKHDLTLKDSPWH